MQLWLGALKAERRKFIELSRIYAADSWFKRDFGVWLLYLLNQVLAYFFYSIRNLDFRLTSSLEYVKTGKVDSISVKNLCKNFIYNRNACEGLIFRDSTKLFLVDAFSELYNSQSPECRNYDSMALSRWIKDNLGREIRSFMHSDYQIISLRIYETLCVGGVHTSNINSRFHADDLLPGWFRLIVYLDDVDDLNGPFLYKLASDEVIAVKGLAGTFVMFKRYVIHAGSPTKRRSRFSMMINICPSILPGRELCSDLHRRPANLKAYINPFARFEKISTI